MDFPSNDYCRLCATLLPLNKLTNLQADAQTRDAVAKKLARLNVSIDWTRADLPENICSGCNDALQSAFLFANSVEMSQNALASVLNANLKDEDEKVNIKVEVQNPFDDDFEFSNDDFNSNIKQEDEEHNIKTQKSIKKEGVRKKKSTTKSKSKSKGSSQKSKLTWKDYIWTCAACGSLYPTFDELRTHSIEIHNSCNKFRCTDCKHKRVKLVMFLRHIETHRNYLKLSCFKCFATFKNAKEARKHKKEHLEDSFNCSGCGEPFPTAEQRDEHENIYIQSTQTFPASEEKSYICSICNRSYINKGSLAAHLIKHSERKREHTCDKCGKNFSSRHNLLAHLKSHDGTKAFQCKMCIMKFATLRKLRDHVECVHMNKKPFTCDQCGRSFRLIGQLKSHSIIHTDEMPFPCTYCDRSFRFKALLTQHIRQHTGVKPYSCVTCQHDFTNWGNYNKHMKRRHGLDTSKRKRTPNGVIPINPNTGEIFTCEETTEIQEWKRQVTARQRKRIVRRKGMPEVVSENVPIDLITTEPRFDTMPAAVDVNVEQNTLQHL